MKFYTFLWLRSSPIDRFGEKTLNETSNSFATFVVLVWNFSNLFVLNCIKEITKKLGSDNPGGKKLFFFVEISEKRSM